MGNGKTDRESPVEPKTRVPKDALEGDRSSGEVARNAVDDAGQQLRADARDSGGSEAARNAVPITPHPRSLIARDCIQAFWYTLIFVGFHILVALPLRAAVWLSDETWWSFWQAEVFESHMFIAAYGVALLASYLMRLGARAILLVALIGPALVIPLRELGDILAENYYGISWTVATAPLLFLGPGVLLVIPATANWLFLWFLGMAGRVRRRLDRLSPASVAGLCLRTATRLLSLCAGAAVFLAALLAGGFMGDIMGSNPPYPDDDSYWHAVALSAYTGAWWAGLYAAVALNISPRAAMAAFPLVATAALLAEFLGGGFLVFQEYLGGGFLIFQPLSGLLQIHPVASALLAGVFLISPVAAKELLRRLWPRVFAAPPFGAGPSQK